MVWKRITNESGKDKQEAENALTCGVLEEYLKGLVLELNLHLLWEREEDSLFPPEELLWVDGITVTSYEVPQIDHKSRKYQALSGKVKHFLRILWKIGQMPYP